MIRGAIWLLALVALCLVTVWAAAAIRCDFPVTNVSLPAAIIYLISGSGCFNFSQIQLGFAGDLLRLICRSCFLVVVNPSNRQAQLAA